MFFLKNRDNWCFLRKKTRKSWTIEYEISLFCHFFFVIEHVVCLMLSESPSYWCLLVLTSVSEETITGSPWKCVPLSTQIFFLSLFFKRTNNHIKLPYILPYIPYILKKKKKVRLQRNAFWKPYRYLKTSKQHGTL